MKTKLTLLAAMLFAVAGFGQTLSIVPPADTVTNSESFTNVTFELWTGAAYQSGDSTKTQGRLGLSYNLYKNIGVGCEIVSENTANVIVEMDAYFEYIKRYDKVEFIGGVGFGRNWDEAKWKGLVFLQTDYNLIRMGGNYVFVGARDEISFAFDNSRPANTIMGIVGTAF